MQQELFNHILINQKIWGEIYRKQRKHRKLQINREQKLRARMYRQKKKLDDALTAKGGL